VLARWWPSRLQQQSCSAQTYAQRRRARSDVEACNKEAAGVATLRTGSPSADGTTTQVPSEGTAAETAA
jgi:hypothetical protein